MFSRLPIYVFLPLNQAYSMLIVLYHFVLNEVFCAYLKLMIRQTLSSLQLVLVVNAIYNYARLVSYLDIYVINSCCAFTVHGIW